MAEIRYQPRRIAGKLWAIHDLREDNLVRVGRGPARRPWRGSRAEAEAEASRLNERQPGAGQEPAPRYTCRKCGDELKLTAFPRGLRQPCRRCLFGPPPRVRFVGGGAPGMGKRHGKRH
jgi:hypothetical protein